MDFGKALLVSAGNRAGKPEWRKMAGFGMKNKKFTALRPRKSRCNGLWDSSPAL